MVVTDTDSPATGEVCNVSRCVISLGRDLLQL